MNMRILFFGTSDFAVPTLEALVGQPEREVVAVVTQPDKPQGRGHRVGISPVKAAALRLELPIHQPRRVRAAEFLETARGLQADVLVLAAFGQLIPPALLEMTRLGPINVHGSLLPAYRGAAPIQYSLLNGETVTGVTTMWMEPTLDTGDILLQARVEILPDDTTGTLTPRLAEAGAKLLLETLDRLEAGNCPRIKQDESLATYSPAIGPNDTCARWTESAERTRNRMRALSPRPGVFGTLGGKRVKLWAAETEPATAAGEPGTVLAVRRDGVEVATSEGTLLLTEVQQENSRRMAAADWARGARLAPGVRFDQAD